MGLLGKETKEFEKRDKSTVAGFPRLNAEVLAKVYRNINEFYGVSKEKWLEDHPDDDKLLSLVRSGNFAKLYAKELFNRKVIVKTPERTEDIKGDWFEYGLGDEEQIADLAEGTGWCVADPYIAHGYLKYGKYVGQDDNDPDDDYESAKHDSKTRFIIFRLEDPDSPGNYATNGSASIRLDLDGKVAEVSGLDDEQAIEDSLIPIVKEKIMSLPGGEKYLQAFEENQTIIRLDRKMQNNEDFSNDELRFLYDPDNPIIQLDFYGADIRIKELKDRYGFKYALEKGLDAEDLFKITTYEDKLKNLEVFLAYGANVGNVVSELHPSDIVKNLDSLLKYGADIDVDTLASELHPSDIVKNLDSLLKHGADIDNIISKLGSSYIADNLDSLVSHGAKIDNIVSNLNSSNIAYNLDYLINHGAKIDNIVSNLDSSDIAYNLDSLINHGANIDIDNLVSKLHPSTIAYNLDSLINHGANIDIDSLVSKLSPSYIADNLDSLINHGANIDIDSLVSKLSPSDIAYNRDSLVRHGANIDHMAEIKNK